MSNSHHSNLKVRCTMDEPIQLLIDKLSSKSNELYIFWQNYNQMYRQYNEKVNENAKLKEQMENLRRSYQSRAQQQTNRNHKEDDYLKERLKLTENTNDSLKQEVQELKKTIQTLKHESFKQIQQTNQMQMLINQLREENALQKNSITNILAKLKSAQNEISYGSKAYEELEQKDLIISKLAERQKELQIIVSEKQEELQQCLQRLKTDKIKYENILKQTLNLAKENTLANLSSTKLFKQKIRMTHDL